MTQLTVYPLEDVVGAVVDVVAAVDTGRNMESIRVDGTLNDTISAFPVEPKCL